MNYQAPQTFDKSMKYESKIPSSTKKLFQKVKKTNLETEGNTKFNFKF